MIWLFCRAVEHLLAMPEAHAGRTDRIGSPSAPLLRRAFVVSLSGAPATDQSAEIVAHIRQVHDAPRALSERGFRLGDGVLDAVSDLLVELVRGDGGGD
jgi:hypothetical protein